MSISTLLVDDEFPARSELKRFLGPEFKVVAEAENGERALQAIQELNPDVVFLDIHIPKLNGLEVASEVARMERPPFIIFVTAYDQYAIQAFELNALDYLLKPYEEERFKKTCERAKAALKHRGEIKERLTSFGEYLKKGKPLKILGHKRGNRERIFIHEAEVLYFHVKLTEVAAHLRNGDEYLVNVTLRSLMEILDPNKFQQTHRAYIVNLDQAEKAAPLFAGNFNLSLKGTAKVSIPLSRRYAKKLRSLMKW